MAEYAYNNSLTTATGTSPFFANFGFDPRTNWPIEAEAKNSASRNYVHWMTSVHALCRKGLEQARETMGKYHHRPAKEPLKYSIGDLVMLNGKNLKTRRPSRKLDAKRHGPFKVSKVLSPTAIKLELPNRWRIHNGFHVSLIEPYRLATNHTRSPPELASASEQNELSYDVDGYEYETGYEVEEIMGSQYSKERKRVLYVVKWKGYLEEADWTEEPYENFDDKRLLMEYHRRNPQGAKDNRIKRLS
jgi:hypothetical protein